MGKEEELEVKKEEKGFLLKLLTLSLRVPLVALLLLVILVFSGTAVFMAKYPNTFSFIGLTGNPQLALQQENEKTIEAVGRLMDLPSDEVPTIATVTDVSAVSDQPFFQSAQNGDRVLIYASAKKAILYRPGGNRIIEVGAVNINQQNQVEISEEEQSTPEVENEEEVTEESIIAPTETPVEEIEEELPEEEIIEF